MSADTLTADDTQAITAPDAPRGGKLRNALWAVFALLCLVLFTVFKIPEVRIKNYVQGQIAAQLAAQGIGLNVSESAISMLFGLNYEMKGVTLIPPAPAPEVKIDRLGVSPSLLSLLTGKLGGSLGVHQGDGSVQGGFKIDPRSGHADIALELSRLNLGRLGVLAIAAGIQGGLIADGEIDIKGDLNALNTLNGEVRLKPSRIVIDPQTIQGFSIPKVSVGSGDIHAQITHGKVQFRTASLGKAGGTDDIVGTMTGTMTLGRAFDQSQVDLIFRFSLSQNLKSGPLGLVDTLLSSMGAKQPDGSYALRLTGSAAAPVAGPLGS